MAGNNGLNGFSSDQQSRILTGMSGGKLRPGYAERRIIPTSESWYSVPVPGAGGVSNLMRLHDGRWGGTNRYAGTGSVESILQVDLQTIRTISRVALYLYAGDDRAYKGIRVSLSVDGVNWLVIHEPASDAELYQTQYYMWEFRVPWLAQDARYVRVRMCGNTINTGNNIDELLIYELVKV